MTTVRGADSKDGSTVELGGVYEGSPVVVCRERGAGSREEGMPIDGSPLSASESALNVFRLLD